jgi:Mg-chelatase subunit ChlD
MLVKRRVVPPTKEILERMKRPGGSERPLMEHVVICIDRSISMDDPVPEGISRLEAAKRASIAIVRESKHCRIGIVSFAFGAQVVHQMSIPGTHMEKAIGSIRTDHSTGIEEGLRKSLSLMDVAGPRRIILLCDGEENVGDAKKFVPVLKATKVVVDCVGFGGNANMVLLNWISSQTGGICSQSYDLKQLQRAFLQLETGARGLLTKGT